MDLKVTFEDDVFVLSPLEGEIPSLRSQQAKVIVGSAQDCDLLMPTANARHLQIERTPQGVVLSHLGPAGATFVNGRRVVRTLLYSGDTVKLEVAEEESLPSGTRTFSVSPLGRASEASLHGRGMEGLLEISAAFARPGTVVSKLEEILEFALRLGHFDRAAVWAVDPENPKEILHHLTREGLGLRPAAVSQTVLRQVMGGEALVITDAVKDDRVAGAISLQAQQVRSCVALPLKTTERVWGALYLDGLHSQPVAGPEEQAFLSGFASLAAVAIENGWLAATTEKQIRLKERLSRFFPPTTVDKILEQPEGRLAGAVTPVTILFCDIRNYTGISFAKPPAVVAAWLDDYFARIVPIVFRHGGTLEKYIGDAMLAIWGAPTPLSAEQQALLACRAAREVHAAVQEFSAAWPQMPCEVGIGIHHGPAYVGTIGHESYLQYAALGSTTNLAARLCSAAGPGETILSRYLADRLPPAEFSSVPMAPVVAKGFPDLIEVSRLGL